MVEGNGDRGRGEISAHRLMLRWMVWVVVGRVVVVGPLQGPFFATSLPRDYAHFVRFAPRLSIYPTRPCGRCGIICPLQGQHWWVFCCPSVVLPQQPNSLFCHPRRRECQSGLATISYPRRRECQSGLATICHPRRRECAFAEVIGYGGNAPALRSL